MTQTIQRFADYDPGCPPDQFPAIKLYEDAEGQVPASGPILVPESGATITFARVAEPTAPFAFTGLSINSASTEIPPLDWYVEDDAAHLRDSGTTSGGGVIYLYTLSIRSEDGKTVYLDPQLVNTGGG